MENTTDNKTVKFGTFAGVFTPSILTIFGVIMFMRANFVTGDAGIINALIILALAQFITFLTTILSMFVYNFHKHISGVKTKRHIKYKKRVNIYNYLDVYLQDV